MKAMLAASSVVFVALTTTSWAGGIDRELGLIVSGVADKWAGVQLIDDGDVDDTLFASGGEGLLSLPLGQNLSIQSDIKYEYNSNAFEDHNFLDQFGPRLLYQGAVHLSWRDPSTGLFGVFGGMGTADASGVDTDLRFVGAEAQIYMGYVTLYGQGGYISFAPDNIQDSFIVEGLDDGFFVRGAVRWFPTPDTRIQLEGTYLSADFGIDSLNNNPDDLEAFSVKARYDFALAGLPLLGSVPLFVAYRGTFRQDCLQDSGFNFDVDDHTFMVGSSYSFSGNRLTIDRHGATLDTPDFTYGCESRVFD